MCSPASVGSLMALISRHQRAYVSLEVCFQGGRVHYGILDIGRAGGLCGRHCTFDYRLRRWYCDDVYFAVYIRCDKSARNFFPDLHNPVCGFRSKVSQASSVETHRVSGDNLYCRKHLYHQHSAVY